MLWVQFQVVMHTELPILTVFNLSWTDRPHISIVWFKFTEKILLSTGNSLPESGSPLAFNSLPESGFPLAHNSLS